MTALLASLAAMQRGANARAELFGQRTGLIHTGLIHTGLAYWASVLGWRTGLTYVCEVLPVERVQARPLFTT